MQHWYSLAKHVQDCYISTMCLFYIHFSTWNLLVIHTLLFSITSLHSCLAFWNLCVLRSCAMFSCSLIIMPIFFIIYTGDIMYLVYWFFFIKYWLASSFSELAYFDWSELEVNRYAINLLNSSNLTFFLFYSPITFLNPSRFSTQLSRTSIPMHASKFSLPCFRRFEYYTRLALSFCFMLTTRLKA